MFIKDNAAVLGKMEELCETLLQQEQFDELRAMLERFAADARAQEQYDHFAKIGQNLLEKERSGIEPTDDEKAGYEREERAVYGNDVIRQYLYANREFDQLKQMIDQYFSKTVETGRVPGGRELIRPIRGCGSHKST
ncbi:MAG: hypothetical protein K0R75_2123 [Paenibacillaceae bacterium]|nr:hypothetical protein [Paenibacillaceae bacterium]